MFNDYIAFDKIPSEVRRKWIYIFSRPFDLSSVKYHESLKIYTTSTLKSVMVCDQQVHQSIEVINFDGNGCIIGLPENEKIHIQAFSCGSKTLKVIYLIEFKDQYYLYAGRYVNNDTVMGNQILRNAMREDKMEYLYVDLTEHNTIPFDLKRKASGEIISMIESHPDNGFRMLIDDYGYEDLIFALVEKGIPIYLDPKTKKIFESQRLLHRFCSIWHDAELILINDLETDFHPEDNVIIIKLSTKSKLKSTDTLREVKYSIHPSTSDIEFLTYIFAPKNIRHSEQ